MNVWALIDKYEGDVIAILNETGRHNVEKQLMELGRREVKEQIDNINEYTIELRQYASSYYFADTYKEAAKKYNELVNVVYKKYYDLTCKIGQNFIGGMPR